jgi:hypothetical protein
MMPTYEFWYSETDVYKAWFDAKNIRQAEKLLREVFYGEKSLDDLPNLDTNGKDYEYEYAPETLRKCD